MSEQKTISAFYEQDHDRLELTSAEEREIVFQNMKNIPKERYRLS